MLFGSISGSVSVSQMSRLSRMSRFSTARSRQSVLFSENGDLQMDTFVRRLRRAESAFETNTTMRDNLSRDLSDAKVQFRRAKEVIDKKRQRIMDWATKLRQRKREYAEHTETIADAEEDQHRRCGISHQTNPPSRRRDLLRGPCGLVCGAAQALAASTLLLL